jgi:hypothetical protein
MDLLMANNTAALNREIEAWRSRAASLAAIAPCCWPASRA